MRELILNSEGISDAPFVADLDHVLDDREGPYSHPNLHNGGHVDIPWVSDFVQGTATWGSGWATDGEW